jgi:hypothetical protein
MFVPSVCFWGSSIMKDPITLGAIGAFAYASYRILIVGKPNIFLILWMIINAYLLIVIKSYILLTFLPGMLLWIVFTKQGQWVPKNLRPVVGPIVLTITIIASLFFVRSFGAKYGSSLNSFANSVDQSRSWILYATEVTGGSAYDLGTFEPTIAGVLKMFPKAVNVALFRPYFFEARTPIIIPSALEGTLSIIIVIRLLFLLGFRRFFRSISRSPDMIFCMSFFIFLGFITGISSWNFGTLVRYKIPCVPFFFIFLSLMYNEYLISKPRLKTIEKKSTLLTEPA